MARVRDRAGRALRAGARRRSRDVARRASGAAPSASGRVLPGCTTRADTRACACVVQLPASLAEYLPAEQPEQTLEPALAYVPAEHCVHEVWLESEIVPAEHSEQLPAPLAEYLPAAQPEQTLEPALEALGAGACRRSGDVASRAGSAAPSALGRVRTSTTTRANTRACACVRARRALRACGMARVRYRPSRALGAGARRRSGDVARRASGAAPGALGRVRTSTTTRAYTRA
eukprot:763347-Hanusia_phi.AAC.1